MLDINFVRSQYPVFQDPDTAEWAFFENAGGSYVPRQVIDRLTHFFKYTKVQPFGLYAPSIEAGEAMDQGYQCMAELLNADPDELTLGPSTSMNTYILAQAIRPSIKSGDEIVITNQDHEANIGCWERLNEFGAVIKKWRINPDTGELNIEDLKKLVTDRTRLVCFSLCSNIVGSVNDAAAISEIAHAAGALVVGDGVSFAPHRIVDVNQLGVDFYLHSTYKTFGPHIGVLWGKKDVLEKLTSQSHYFNADIPHYRMNPAGPLHAEIGALAGIGEYYEAVYAHHFNEPAAGLHEKAERVFDLFSEQETKLANQLLQALQDLPDARIVGKSRAETGKRASTISIIPLKRKPSDIVKELAAKKIAVGKGHFYGRRCVEALGVEDPDEGVVRISLVHYNTEEEVDLLINNLSM